MHSDCNLNPSMLGAAPCARPMFDAALVNKISELRARLIALRGPHHEAATATGGLPIYADLGGVLCVTPTGEVRAYDSDSFSVRTVEDPVWVEIALTRLASLDPALSAVAPTRPEDAGSCPACGATGVYWGGVCLRCLGRGWTSRDGR